LKKDNIKVIKTGSESKILPQELAEEVGGEWFKKKVGSGGGSKQEKNCRLYAAMPIRFQSTDRSSFQTLTLSLVTFYLSLV
jgi:hypothetical protein